MTIREEVESMEKQMLSRFAQLSITSKGRQYAEEKCSIRTDFQRDRDRIIYSKAFRRLKHKTQVFISPEGDHYRTRLTHTLEVSQIARTIARSLRLNEDLTEAISLGHDLGHTPFGHAGERVLNEVCPQGFKHNEQSLRVVEVLERNNGLNLTWEVRDGILNHTGENSASTLEGQIVKFADRIAYINHDIDDAIRGKVLSEESLPRECVLVLGNKSSKRIDAMIKDIVQNSRDSTKISMGPEVAEATNKLRNFMFKNVYVDSIAKKEEKKAANILKELYVYLGDNPEILPEEMKSIVPMFGLDRIVCDYIAGMTDRYAVKKFSDIFIPTSWN